MKPAVCPKCWRERKEKGRETLETLFKGGNVAGAETSIRKRYMSKDRDETRKPRPSKALPVQQPSSPNPSQPKKDAADQMLAAGTKEEKDTLLKRLRKEPPKFTKGVEGKLQAADDPVLNHIRMLEAFATGDTDLINHLLGQLAATVPYGERGGISNVNFVAAALHSIVPRDGLEVLLSIQMIGVHNLAMEFLKLAALKEQTEFGLDANVNRATRFLQTFAKQMEVLKA